MSSVEAKYATLLFSLSYHCNLRCDICSVGDRLEWNDELSFDDATRVAKECHSLGFTKRVGFTGGEPFLKYKRVLAIARHVYDDYGWQCNITTNCTWAGSEQLAVKRLSPLARSGLTWLLISIDDSHLRQTTAGHVANAIRSARHLGIRCQVQTVVTNNSRRADDFRASMEEFAGDEGIEWRDSRCVPMGFAAGLPEAEMPLSPGVMMGGCTLYKFIAVMPNGDVGLCCSYFPESLVVGNVHRQSIPEIVCAAEQNLLCSAVFVWGGPKLIANLLAERGLPSYRDTSYTNVCHACHSILSDETAVNIVTPALKAMESDLLQLKDSAEQEWSYLADRESRKQRWNVSRLNTVSDKEG